MVYFFSMFDQLNSKFYKNNDCTYFLRFIIPEITMVYITHGNDNLIILNGI